MYAEIPRTKMGALLHAVCLGREEAAKLLLQNGCDPNRKNSTGVTPLHVVAVNSRHSITNVLLHHSADRDIAMDGEERWVSLNIALAKGDEELAQILLTYRRDS